MLIISSAQTCLNCPHRVTGGAKTSTSQCKLRKGHDRIHNYDAYRVDFSASILDTMCFQTFFLSRFAILIRWTGNKMAVVAAGNKMAVVVTGSKMVVVVTENKMVVVATGNKITVVAAGNKMAFVVPGNKMVVVEAGNKMMAIVTGNKMAVVVKGNKMSVTVIGSKMAGRCDRKQDGGRCGRKQDGGRLNQRSTFLGKCLQNKVHNKREPCNKCQVLEYCSKFYYQHNMPPTLPSWPGYERFWYSQWYACTTNIFWYETLKAIFYPVYMSTRGPPWRHIVDSTMF